MKDLSPRGQALKRGLTAIAVVGALAATAVLAAPLASAAAPASYSNDVLSDGAVHYWPLSMPDSSRDLGSSRDGLGFGGVKNVGQPGAILTDAVNTSVATQTWQGDNPRPTLYTESAIDTPVAAPTAFSEEGWFNTSFPLPNGGLIMGYSNSGTSALPGTTDRQVAMASNGTVSFTVTYSGKPVAVSTTKAYNDGQWHQAVSTMSSTGITLYVDGALVGAKAGVASTALAYKGGWQMGCNCAKFFDGSLDAFSVYNKVLSAAQVAQHFADSGRATVSPYAKAVIADGAAHYWRLGETNSSLGADKTGAQPLTYSNQCVSFDNPCDWGHSIDVASTAGAIKNDTDPAGVFGSLQATTPASATPAPAVDKTVTTAPTTVSEEAWFNTTSKAGGQILGFSDSAGLSNAIKYDRAVYMTPDGKVSFGSWYHATVAVTTTKALNDGQWHHVVGVMTSTGISLYVDGALVGTKAAAASNASVYNGYWHVGGGQSWYKGSFVFNGSIDEAAVYSTALTAAQVKAHYTASGR
jgi:hypothetical protein